VGCGEVRAWRAGERRVLEPTKRLRRGGVEWCGGSEGLHRARARAAGIGGSGGLERALQYGR